MQSSAFSCAASVAKYFAMPASRSARSPEAFRRAAWRVSSRAASVRVAIFASISCTAWWCAIGLPNASRSCAYRSASSSAACATPTPRAATLTRPTSIPLMKYLKP